MLPEPHRLRTSRDFQRVFRGGRKIGRHDIVVHVLAQCPTTRVDTWGGPRFGLVVNKAVGGSVQRHRTARVLRAAAAVVTPSTDPRASVVIRALPSAATANSTDIARQLLSALRKLNCVPPAGGAA